MNPPSKRARHSPSEPASPAFPSGTSPSSEPTSAPATQSSSFRNVSACNRCRLRKNRCDQNLPSCASCEKANVRCTGYDPITKREIPRSYVFYLESRVSYLESVLDSHRVPYNSAEVLDNGPQHMRSIPSPIDEREVLHAHNGDTGGATAIRRIHNRKELRQNIQEESSINSCIDPNLAPRTSDPRHLGSTSGISFAKVVFAAVKSSVSSATDKAVVKPNVPVSAAKGATQTPNGSTSMRDSFFGLHPKPTIRQAPFPKKELGRKLVDLYFEHANPQMPILHRPSFMEMFENAYKDQNRALTSREEYMLNIVFAIGAGIVLDSDQKENESDNQAEGGNTQQCQPEEYHASAIVHLEACLSHSSATADGDGFGGGLEELQAILLLAGFALLRPVAPGLWYIVGAASRLGVDLGLYYEDGKDIEDGLGHEISMKEEYSGKNDSVKERGRRQWIRDLRRRLWWCCYAFDRLVSTCVFRPLGITDQVITTEFPSLLDDKYITPGGFLQPPARPDGSVEPSYKVAAHHYIRLRLLQSEILQVLQHQQAKQARAAGANRSNPYINKDLPSPFLVKFASFRDWRIDIDRRLWQWKESAPTKAETGVAFSVEFLELNYWQAIIMLYRQSLSVPPMFVVEVNLVGEEVESPSMRRVEERDDEERVYLKVAEAGQKVLRLYRQLHRIHLVNYTFLATHHLFMAGISFLYAIWHSPIVRSRLTMEEVDITILAATSVLGDLIPKCPPAERVLNALNRMSQATIQMCRGGSTGFSSSSQGGGLHSQDPQVKSENGKFNRVSSQPTFYMALNDLYPPTSSGSNQNRFGNDKSHGTERVRQVEAQTSYPPVSQPSSYSMPPPEATRDVNASIDPALLPPQEIPEQRQTRQEQGGVPSCTEIPTSNASAIGNMYSNGQFLDGTNGMDWSTMNLDFLGSGTPGNDVDLGFGLGYDQGFHDFSNGNHHDLFEGFFFGNI